MRQLKSRLEWLYTQAGFLDFIVSACTNWNVGTAAHFFLVETNYWQHDKNQFLLCHHRQWPSILFSVSFKSFWINFILICNLLMPNLLTLLEQCWTHLQTSSYESIAMLEEGQCRARMAIQTHAGSFTCLNACICSAKNIFHVAEFADHSSFANWFS